MKIPDFTQPYEGGRCIEVQGCTLYVPRGISYHPRGQWRVTVQSQSEYLPVGASPLSSLSQAYRQLHLRRQQSTRPVKPHGPRKRFDTGVIGVRVTIEVTQHRVYVAVYTQQMVLGRSRQVTVDRRPIAETSQAWLDQTLCDATGMRWTYLQLKAQGLVKEVVQRDDVAPDMRPDTPVRQVPVYKVLDYATELSNNQLVDPQHSV